MVVTSLYIYYKVSFTYTRTYPMVTTQLTSLESAHLTVMAEVTNYANSISFGVLSISFPGIAQCAQKLQLEANSTQQIFFDNTTCKELDVVNPKLWWPVQMGSPCIFCPPFFCFFVCFFVFFCFLFFF
jgi:hypothetical protein